MIVRITGMSKMPDSCKECQDEYCTLPLKGNKYQAQLKAEYATKRHPKCPLREIKED